MLSAMRAWTGVVLALALVGCGGGGGGPSFAITALGLSGQTPGDTAAGDVAGNEVLVIEGAGFDPASTFFFGTTPAVTVVFVSETELRVTTPAMPAGTVDIRVVNPDGAETVLEGAFTFGTPPTLATIVALDGPGVGTPLAVVDGTTMLELTGTGFEDGATVEVDGVSTTATFVDDTTLRCEAPNLPTERVATVVVRNPTGFTAMLAETLEYTQRYSLVAQPGGLDEAQVRHLLKRAGFGAPDTLVQSYRNQQSGGLADQLLTFRRDGAVIAVERDARAIFDVNPPPTAEANARTYQEWYIHLLRHNPRVLQERLAWFLHNHFATSQIGLGGGERWWIHEQIELFRSFGRARVDGGLDFDWRELCIRICKDRAMLRWLDGVNSRRGAPNENFARELWELFMLGEGRGYTQEDIVEASKAFTGFRRVDVEETDYDTVRYEASRHDESQKTIFGVTGNFGYDSISPYHENGENIETDPRDTDGGIVALTLRERPIEASTFICRKLAQYFLYDDVTDEMVNELAQILRDNDWNMRPVLRAMITSKAMFSSHARKAQIKQPIEYVLQFLRNTDIDTTESRIRGALDSLQQEPLEPPGVEGWPRGNAWMGGQAMLERINFLRDVVRDLDDTPSQINPLLPPAGQRSPSELVDHLARLIGVELTEFARTRMIEYVTTELEGETVVPFDFDPTDDRDLRMKTRGLLYLLAQYHDGHRQ